MKLKALLLLVIGGALAGCVVHTHPRNGCGPYHYWNGHRCVRR